MSYTRFLLKFIMWLTIGGTIVVIMLFFLVLWASRPMNDEVDDVLTNKNFYIAHAASEIDGFTYLNCKEGLLKSLQEGYKNIELDLSLTSDSVLVCTHDWSFFNKMTLGDSVESDAPLTSDEFSERKIMGRFTPLTLEEAILIRKEHPFTLVTDKISDADLLNRYFPEGGRDSIMVEAFSDKDYLDLKKCGYTPMRSIYGFTYKNLLQDFVIKSLKEGVKYDWIVTSMDSDMKCLRILKRLFGCKVAIFTSNSDSFFNRRLGKEVDMVYTDNKTF